MNREIKFRAWDKESKKMVYQDQLKENDEYWFMLDKQEIKLMRFDKYYNAYVETEADIMQYTEINDYGGEAIYEGDIVKKEFAVLKEYPIQPTVELSEFKGVVRMLEGGWVVVNEKLKNGYYLWDETDMNFVIGNIYENSNLLKEL